MKLNLLPTYVSKEKQGRIFVFLAAVMALASVAGAVWMVLSSRDSRRDAIAKAVEMEANAIEAVEVSKQADEVIKQGADILRNISLAKAMKQHNFSYPKLYDYVKDFVPDFFRLQSMSAVPLDDKTCQITLQGTIKSQQQYADLMLALLQMEGATTPARAGYNVVDTYVPNLTETDRMGRPIKPGDANIPDNGYDRLNYYMQKGSAPGFEGVGGFGTDDDTQPRGAMPDWSLVTVSVNLPTSDKVPNLQVPNPRSTLSAAGSATVPQAAGATQAGAPAAGGQRGGAARTGGGPE